MTVSEQCFLDYCKRCGYVAEAIPRQPNVRKTADFRVRAGPTTLVVEIKELVTGSLPPEEAAKDSGERGSRARRHLRSAAAQLRPYRSEKVPMLVVLYDNREAPPAGADKSDEDLSAGEIEAAMYGGQSGKRVNQNEAALMTESDRCYVSAVCVLSASPAPSMATYRNRHAKIPLPLDLFNS